MSEKKLKLYLDMCIYNRPFDDQNDLRIRLETVACQLIFEKIQNNEFDLVWSFMLEFENAINPLVERRGEIIILSQLSRHIVEPSQDILYKAEEIQKYSIKGSDSVHLACAELSNCSYFITCDDRIIRRSEKLGLCLVVCNPLQFIQKEVKNEK